MTHFEALDQQFGCSTTAQRNHRRREDVIELCEAYGVDWDSLSESTQNRLEWMSDEERVHCLMEIAEGA
jgi:hypothetical protein